MSDASVTTSEFRTLMDEMSQGSEDAAWRITEVYTPHIIRAIRATLPKIIRSKADSQDYAQAVWASVLLGGVDLNRFACPEQFIAFLASTARHKVIDNYRHYTHTQAYNVKTEVSIEADVSTDVDQKRARTRRGEALKSREMPGSQVARLREQWSLVLQKCSDRDREIVSLRFSGLELQEIADRLQVNEKTVRRRLNHVADGMRL